MTDYIVDCLSKLAIRNEWLARMFGALKWARIDDHRWIAVPDDYSQTWRLN